MTDSDSIIQYITTNDAVTRVMSPTQMNPTQTNSSQIVPYGQVQVADFRGKQRRYRQNALNPEIVAAIQSADDGEDFFDFLNEHWHTAKQQLVKTSLEKGTGGIEYLLEYTNPLNEQKTAILSMSDLKTFLKQIGQFRQGPSLRIVEDDDD